MTTEVKTYTKAEIAAFTLEEAEAFAVNLSWKDKENGWGQITQNARYVSTGHPRVFAQTAVTDRRHYLTLRLRAAKQETWNTEAKALLAEQQKKEAEEKKRLEEKAKCEWKTKSKVSLKTNIIIELHDHRIDGHTFILERSNGKVSARQKPLKDRYNSNTKGTTNCGAQENFDAQKFQDAVLAVCDLELPKLPDKVGGLNLIVSITLSLTGGNGNQIFFFREGDIVGITTNHPRNRRPGKLDTTDWQFNISDLKETIKTLNTKYEVTEKKE